ACDREPGLAHARGGSYVEVRVPGISGGRWGALPVLIRAARVGVPPEGAAHLGRIGLGVAVLARILLRVQSHGGASMRVAGRVDSLSRRIHAVVVAETVGDPSHFTGVRLSGESTFEVTD